MRPITVLRRASVALLAGSVGMILGPAYPVRAVGAPAVTRPVVNIAHAGGDLEAPHSTLYAMQRAVDLGVDILDMDLRLSADGVIMVQHDETVDRLTPDSGAVAGFTAAELGAMDNAYWFVPDCWSCHDRPPSEYRFRGVRTGGVAPPAGSAPDDFGIPTLAEVVRRFPDHRLNVEIKDGIAGAEALAAFIAAHGPADRFIVLSFDDATIERFHELAPDVPMGPGLQTVTRWFAERGSLPGYRYLEVPPTYGAIEVVTPKFVADAHAAGLLVYVWFDGADDDVASEWQRLLAMGVDGLDTARPGAAEPYVAAENARRAAAATTTTTTAPAPVPTLPATGGATGATIVLGVAAMALGAGLRRIGVRRR